MSPTFELPAAGGENRKVESEIALVAIGQRRCRRPVTTSTASFPAHGTCQQFMLWKRDGSAFYAFGKNPAVQPESRYELRRASSSSNAEEETIFDISDQVTAARSCRSVSGFHEGMPLA